MLSRCLNPKATGYQFYGGRGITVCPQWRESFENFFSDMGPRPEGMSLDRIDPNGNYEPTNCRWATSKEQRNNTTDNHLLEYGGVSKTIAQWAESLDILPNTIYYRLARGWTVPEALGAVPRTPRWQHRLSVETVAEIVRRHAAGETQTSLGQEFNLHSSQVSRLCKRYS